MTNSAPRWLPRCCGAGATAVTWAAPHKPVPGRAALALGSVPWGQCPGPFWHLFGPGILPSGAESEPLRESDVAISKVIWGHAENDLGVPQSVLALGRK